MHAPSGEKNGSKDSFYEELGRVFFYHFPKYHVKILLDFECKIGETGYFQTVNWE